MSEPYYSGAERMGRNKELTDEWTFLEAAKKAVAGARKSAGVQSVGESANKPMLDGAKETTGRPLSV